MSTLGPPRNKALSDLTKDIFYVEPGFLVILSRDGYEMYDLNTGMPVKPALLKPNTITIELAKGNFAHFMLKEIYETPEVLARILYILQREYLNDASNVILKAKNIFIVGSGTSYHAGLIGRYYLQSMSNVKADVVPAGEFLYEAINYVEPGTVIIAISQSGESTDIIRVVRASKRRGAVILSIVNRLGSTLMRESNVYLPVGAGPEVAVPATKTFTGTLSILLQLAGYAGGKFDEVRNGIDEARNVLINNLDAIKAKAAEIAKELKNYNNAYVISGGPLGMPLAMEMALKLKEAARVHAEAVNLREFKHGPMTLIEREFPTFLISIPGEFEDDMANIASEIWARGGTTILITSNKMRASTDYKLKVAMSTLEERRYLTPLLYAPNPNTKL